ncbi:MAG TPA: alpha-amylase family glycosyl hydrolase [Pyrinomonadaceae bacterium]
MVGGSFCLALSFGSTNAQSGPPVVTRIEPPSWWANHSINPVRLLLRGKNLFGARVRPTNAATRTSSILINKSGTYLFVNVFIRPSAVPGNYPLIVETTEGSVTVPFSVGRQFATSDHFQGITNDEVIYLIMIDRFANGDVSNDVPPGSPPGANDRSNPRAYHGGDLHGIIDHLPYLKDLGVTALWLTPWYDNWNGLQMCDKAWCPSTYYHGYHAIDYYDVEDHFGTIATLRELIEKAHNLGIKVIQDQVANHVGSRHPWVEDPPLGDWFHGTLAQHSRNRFNNSVLLSPHGNQDEVRNTLDGWFSDDLPDMNQDQPEVARYEIQNSLWWVGMTGIDGIRQDTIQYMPRTFIRELSDALHRQYPKMWMVGEVFERDAAQTAFFIGGHVGWDMIDTRLDSDFDFSLWNVSLKVFTHKLPVHFLRDQLKYDALYPDASRLTVLSNNHDTARFMSLDGATLEGAMMHVAFILSVRGIPQLYSGEEIAMEGKDDPDNRRDFPGGFPGDKNNAFSAEGRTATQQRMYEWTRSWIKLRRDHSSLRQGKLIDLLYDDDSYVFARQDKSETVVISINRSTKPKQATLSLRSIGFANGELEPLQQAGSISQIRNGEAHVILPANTASAYRVR